MSRIKIEKFEYEDGTSEYKILVNVNYVISSFKNKINLATIIDGEWAPVFTKYSEELGIGIFNVHPFGRTIYHTFEDAMQYIPVVRDRILINDEFKITKNRTVCYEV